MNRFKVPVVALAFLASSDGVVAGIISPSDAVSNWSKLAGPRTGTGPGSATVVGNEILLTNNNNAISLISDFFLGDGSFSGSFRTTDEDDDILGFYFGFQDLDNHYRFAWSALDFNGGLGDELGTNGSPNVPGRSRVHGLRLIKEVGGINTFLYQDPLGSVTSWTRNTLYDFSIRRDESALSLTITEGANQLLDITVLDAGFTDGKVGIFQDSQTDTFFSNLDASPVPEPSTLVIWTLIGGVGLVGGNWRSRMPNSNGGTDKRFASV